MANRKLYKTQVTFYPIGDTYDDFAYVFRNENETIEHIVPNEDEEPKDGIGFLVDDNMEKIEINKFHISQPRELIVSYNLVNKPVEQDFWAIIENYLFHYTIYKSCRYYTHNNTIKNMYLLESAYKIPDETLRTFFIITNGEEIEENDISYLLEHSEEQTLKMGVSKIALWRLVLNGLRRTNCYSYIFVLRHIYGKYP